MSTSLPVMPFTADLRGLAAREIDRVERATADQPGGVLAFAFESEFRLG
jgi:hypothetical protein